MSLASYRNRGNTFALWIYSSTQEDQENSPILIGLLSGLNILERSIIDELNQERLDDRRSIGASLVGRPKISKAKEGLVMLLRIEGCSYRNIRDQTGLALATIRIVSVEQEEAVGA